MTNFNIDSQSINFDRRTVIIGTGAVAASSLLLSKGVNGLPIDPTISAYVNWIRSEEAWVKVETEIAELGESIPDLETGYVWTEYGIGDEPNVSTSLLVTSYDEIDRLAIKGLSDENAKEFLDNLRGMLDRKIKARQQAELEIGPKLVGAKRTLEQAKKKHAECEEVIFNVAPTSILGATLKMNAIASHGTAKPEAVIALQDEMMGMARLQGQHIEHLPVELFDLRFTDSENSAG